MSGDRTFEMKPKRAGKTADALARCQSVCAKQKQEIARLTREVEQLRADKRNLTFDINKLKVANEQLRGA